MATPSGLTADQVASLSDQDAVLLAEWQARHTGAEGFVPQAIRRMPLETRLKLAASPVLDEAWRRRERERVAESATYMLTAYGSVEPPRGPAIPFIPWPAQLDVMDVLETDQKIWVLKARRLGLTWLVLHYGFWLAAFAEDTPGSRILVFCKTSGDAGKLLSRMRAIHDRMPPWLRVDTGRDSVTSMSLPGRRSEIMALPATEAAARQETATLVVLDEFAFPRNRAARGIWTAVQPTIEGGGQLVGISTGNGLTGDGETFAAVWHEASSGNNGITPVFLPWSARPDRTEEWREQQRADYLSNEEFEAEYPDDPEQALSGHSSIHVYPHSGITASERIGEQLADRIEDLKVSGYEWGIDWGDYQTFAVYALPLGGGGVYVVDEKVLAHVEPSRASHQIIFHQPGGDTEAVFSESRADSAPAGTNATFLRVLDDARTEHPGRFPPSHLRVPFGQYKEGGGDRRGVNTVAFIRRGFELAEQVPADWQELADLDGVIAIHPRCQVLLAQLRALERDNETGKVRKPGISPSDPTRGDHGPDALVALLAPRAAEWTVTAHQARENAEDVV
jgi:hypothetical protein